MNGYGEHRRRRQINLNSKKLDKQKEKATKTNQLADTIRFLGYFGFYCFKKIMLCPIKLFV